LGTLILHSFRPPLPFTFKQRSSKFLIGGGWKAGREESSCSSDCLGGLGSGVLCKLAQSTLSKSLSDFHPTRRKWEGEERESRELEKKVETGSGAAAFLQEPEEGRPTKPTSRKHLEEVQAKVV